MSMVSKYYGNKLWSPYIKVMRYGVQILWYWDMVSKYKCNEIWCPDIKVIKYGVQI